MARDYYDVLVQESSLGDLTLAEPGDLERYVTLAEEELAQELQADIRVRLTGDGDSYTAIAADGQTWQGPLSEEMTEALGRAFERWIG